MALRARYPSLILSGLCCIGICLAERTHANQAANGGGAAATEQDRQEAARTEAHDRFAMALEAERLHVLLARALGLPTPSMLDVLYLPMVAYVLDQANQASFADIERALRRTNSGIHLFAVHESLNTNPRARVAALPGRPATSHWVFMSNEGPDVARIHRRDNRIGSDEENLRLLETAGIRMRATSI